jgi:glycosyltransferase involved in cell wall biosynthesis
MLLWLGFRYKINRLFAFGHTYSLFLQPLRLLKNIPLTLFLRADTLKNHQIKDRNTFLINLEHFFEGLGIASTVMYAVSENLIQAVNARHTFLRPKTSGVLRNEVVIPKNRDTKKRKLRFPLRAACVGVLEPRKNQRLLLEVFQGISAEQAQLYLYGTGPDEELLRERVQKENMTNRVHFMGWVPSENIWPQVDLLLMPSLHEGAPNAVLEALGYGIPVLASDIPEHVEILPKEYLLSIDNISEWNSFIQVLINELKTRLFEIIQKQEITANELRFEWNKAFIQCIDIS